MKGYVRLTHMAWALSDKLDELMAIYPEMRLGQLISNLTRDKDLFEIFDEDLLKAIENMIDTADRQEEV